MSLSVGFLNPHAAATEGNYRRAKKQLQQDSFLEKRIAVTKIKLVQAERSNPLWEVLVEELAVIFEGELELIFPTEWNKHYFDWFHSMEKTGFRQELHYSFEELTKILENPELVFWFITKDGEPQILLLGYSLPDKYAETFYLDTFAVKPRGKGIGSIVIDFLIHWAKIKLYKSIVLDTELRDEKGFSLKQFYTKHGFKTVSISEKGDAIMKRLL